jgi:flavin-dependent dehydrogenase
MSQDSVDVAIVGGGPAGVAAAISLLNLMPQAKISILEAQSETTWKHGETLSPAAAPVLASLGCWDALQRKLADGMGRESFGTTAAWGQQELQANDFLFSMHGNGWQLDRASFDRWLLEHAIERGAVVHRGIVLTESGELNGGGWWLRCGERTVQARFVIDASGRRAAFARQRGSRVLVTDQLTAMFVLWEEVPPSSTMIEAAEDGWWYSTSVPSDVTVSAWMTDADLLRGSGGLDLEAWQKKLANSVHTKARLDGARMMMQPRVFAAQSQRLDSMGGTAWVACGDTAMTFDPLSSHGITKALRGGKLASFVAADFLLKERESHKRYEQILHEEYAQYLQTRGEFYREEQRWPESLFWARRHTDAPSK